MADDPLFIAAAIACFVVLVILILGISAFSRGGEFNKKYGNKLMQYRLLAQAVAVVLILLFVTLSGVGK